MYLAAIFFRSSVSLHCSTSYLRRLPVLTVISVASVFKPRQNDNFLLRLNSTECDTCAQSFPARPALVCTLPETFENVGHYCRGHDVRLL